MLLGIGVCSLPLVFAGDVDGKILGIAWTTAFALLARTVFNRGSDRTAVITISASGFHDKRVSKLPIPWAEILHAELFEAEQIPFLGFDLRDRRAVLRNTKLLVRFVAPLHRLLGFPAISINTSLLDGTDEEVMAAIERFRH